MLEHQVNLDLSLSEVSGRLLTIASASIIRVLKDSSSN